MRYLLLIALALCGCASTGPNKIMALNCQRVNDNVFVCDEIPERPKHEPRVRN